MRSFALIEPAIFMPGGQALHDNFRCREAGPVTAEAFCFQEVGEILHARV